MNWRSSAPAKKIFISRPQPRSPRPQRQKPSRDQGMLEEDFLRSVRNSEFQRDTPHPCVSTSAAGCGLLGGSKDYELNLAIRTSDLRSRLEMKKVTVWIF